MLQSKGVRSLCPHRRVCPLLTNPGTAAFAGPRVVGLDGGPGRYRELCFVKLGQGARTGLFGAPYDDGP